MAARTTVPAGEGSTPPRRSKRRRRVSTGTVIGAANCALGGVTTAYVTSHSVPVTLTAAGAAVLLAGLAVIRG